MAVSVPELSAIEFGEELSQRLAEPLTAATAHRLFCHYRELRRWSTRLALIGRGTESTLIARHYAESLAALPLLGDCRRLLDVGSGAGFPGWILAAARPDIDVWLVESRGRKASFLRSAAHRAALSCTVLDARVAAPLPPAFPGAVDVVTIRAVRLGARTWGALGAQLAPTGRILRWVGPQAEAPPAGWVGARRRPLAASQRAIEELVRQLPTGGREDESRHRHRQSERGRR